MEKIDTSSKTKGQYTRVSFIAMFDPIKPATPPPRKLAETTLPSGDRSVDSTDFVTPKARTTISPLVKGLPTPAFVMPNRPNHIGVQTDPVVEEQTVISEPASPESDYNKVWVVSEILYARRYLSYLIMKYFYQSGVYFVNPVLAHS